MKTRMGKEDKQMEFFKKGGDNRIEWKRKRQQEKEKNNRKKDWTKNMKEGKRTKTIISDKKWNEKERKVWKMITKLNEINIERKKEDKNWQDYKNEEKYNV